MVLIGSVGGTLCCDWLFPDHLRLSGQRKVKNIHTPLTLHILYIQIQTIWTLSLSVTHSLQLRWRFKTNPFRAQSRAQNVE